MPRNLPATAAIDRTSRSEPTAARAACCASVPLVNCYKQRYDQVARMVMLTDRQLCENLHQLPYMSTYVMTVTSRDSHVHMTVLVSAFVLTLAN